MKRVDENDQPVDEAMSACLARLATLEPDARQAVLARIWDGRRSREQLAHAVAELRALVPYHELVRFEWASRAVTGPWLAAEGEALAPPWIGPHTRQALASLAYNGSVVTQGWSLTAFQLATAAVYFRAELSRPTLGVLYYPFEVAVPFASLDAAMGAMPDPTDPATDAPPLVPPVELAKVNSIVDFLRNAPDEALEDTVDGFLEDVAGDVVGDVIGGLGPPTAAGPRARQVYERELDAALDRARVRDEADAHVERAVDALRARDDAWRVPDGAREPDARVPQALGILLVMTKGAIRAIVAGEALPSAVYGPLVRPVLRAVERHVHEVDAGRRPAVLPPRRVPRRTASPVAVLVDPPPDRIVLVRPLQLEGVVRFPLTQSAIFTPGVRERLLQSPDGSIPAFATPDEAVDHVEQHFPLPGGLPKDMYRALRDAGTPLDLDPVRALPETGWESSWSLDDVEQVWLVLAAAGELPPLRESHGSVGSAATSDDLSRLGRTLAARWREAYAAYDEALRPRREPPRPPPDESRSLFVREMALPEPSGPPPSPWQVGPKPWTAEEFAALRGLLQRGVDALAARIRVVPIEPEG